MALIGSLSSGVSAMQSFVKGMEVIGDNIANSKTVGFKKQRSAFTDNFSQTLRDATPGQGNASNLPAIQVGSGVSLASTQKLFGQGAIETTGVASDLAISGDGFFRVYNGATEEQYLTRDGSFRVNEEGFLTDKAGNFLLGVTGGTAEQAPDTMGQIQVGTEDLGVRQNDAGQPVDLLNRLVLDDGSRALTNSNSTSGFYRVDEDGRLLDTANLPTIEAVILQNAVGTETDPRAALHTDGNHYLINDAGNYIDDTGAELAGPIAFDPAVAAAAGAVEWNPATQPFASIGDGTGPEADAEWTAGGAGGSPEVAAPDATDPNQFSLAVQNWTINRDGEVRLSLNDGSSFVTAKVLIQDVRDPDALTEVGTGLYTGLENAGAIGLQEWVIGGALTETQLADLIPNSAGRGFIQSRALEGSNTDLTREFSDMITTQRAFQAGSKVITVSDEMLQEIINLKR